MEKNENLAAYPQTAFDKEGNLTTWEKEHTGLTKREWMVGQVAAGWNISQSALKDERVLAFGIVEVADLILKRLEETKL